MSDIMRFHRMLYATQNKIQQDILLLKFCEGAVPKKGSTNMHSISIKYQIPTQKGSKLRVCKKAFLGITHVSPDRIERIVRNFIKHGEAPTEKRGGDKVLNANIGKRLRIKQFVESLTCVESHYRRNHTTRLYLPCDLNFTKLHKIFCNKNQDVAVKLCFFRNYVNKNYNLAFGTPLTDACSTCLQVKEKLKQAKSDGEKVNIMTQQRIHTLRAKAFYDLLKRTDENTVMFSFDCQKNLALPKLPDQSAYFSQQINFFNFTVVCGNSQTKLTPENVKSYVWLENEFAKNSNAIASGIYNVLINQDFPKNVNKINFFADGCGGQNKNSTLMFMLAYWLLNKAPAHIKTLEVVFPIVGHSFLPPDRVFGLTERKIKKQNVIIKREEYEEMIGNYSTVLRLGEKWNILDWRTLANYVFKKPGQWHFRFNESKRFILIKSNKNVMIRGEAFYRSDFGVPKTVTKRGRNLYSLQPKVLNIQGFLKGDKSTIDNLLKSHYGQDWRNNPALEFYKIIDGGNTPEASDEEGSQEEYECEDGAAAIMV
nr:unnamed protein product [Callosobruchus chinensis]